jgi:beta-galactosidase
MPPTLSRISVGLFTLLGLVLAICPSLKATRTDYNFDPGWRLQVGDAPGAEAVAFDDSAWKPVTLPHAWNEDSAFKVSIDDLPTGIAWYRKSFVLPPEASGKKIFVEFEGVRQGAEFFLNGKSLGLHEDGITAVGFDLTALALPAPAVNVLSVRTDNAWDYREKSSNSRYQWNDKNFNANYGGIPKHVRLHVTDLLHQTLPLLNGLGTTGVYVYPTDFDLSAGSARIHAESEVRNDDTAPRAFSYEVTVAELDGRVLASFTAPETLTLAPGTSATITASSRVKSLQWWSWGYGRLYDVTTTLFVEGKPADSVRTRTGFRQTKFAEGMVTLNGRVLQMKGYAQRTSNEWPAIGMSVPAWLSDFSNGLMVESGANLVRWMHISPWKQDVESCDRVGLLQAMPAGDSEKDVTGTRWTQRVAVMRASMIYYRNNPSVLFYESGNNGISEEHMAEMKALKDRYDPHGGRASGSRDMLGSRVADYGGEMLYINKSARIPFWAMEYSRDEGLRKYWDEFTPPFHKEGDGPLHKNAPATSYNHNQDAHAVENVRRWYDYWLERPGTGTRVSSGGVNIIFSDSNTHHRGAENYRRSGEVDAMRIPKDGFYAHQVMWDGWVDVEKPRAHLIGHWNYTPGVKKPVQVVSSADVVELFLNGKSLGRSDKPEYRFLFTFADIIWQPGTLEAIGYDKSGKEICRDRHETAGAPFALRLTSRVSPDGLGFKADGADLALVEVEVVDSAGRRVPTALDTIDFTLDGPAEWRGGIAQGPDNFILSRSLPVECGVNRVLLRSTPASGRVTLRATAAGLKSAELVLATVAVPSAVSTGVYPISPDSGLAPSLARGPTPSGPSFHVTRTPVAIASAKAGGNADKIAFAYDDNEETTWTNGDTPDSAWAEFTLARPAKLTELTARLPGWRSRSYPILVTVDGVPVYRGATSPNLGYVTLPLKTANAGQVVRIQLTGKGETNIGFGEITEVNNAKNASDGAPAAKGSLGIVEIEFYEAAPAAP